MDISALSALHFYVLLPLVERLTLFRQPKIAVGHVCRFPYENEKNYAKLFSPKCFFIYLPPRRLPVHKFSP